MPIGKPTSMPTTGITKKPTIANRPPTTRVVVGTAALSRRPGTAYLTIAPTARIAVATAKTVQASAPPSSEAHTRKPSSTSSVPGSTGTTMPNRPITTRRPHRTVMPVMVGSLPHRRRRAVLGRRRPRTSRSGALVAVSWARCPGTRWSAFGVGSDRRCVGQLLGLVDDVGRDLAELLAVLAGVVGTEEQLTAGLELDPQVGLRSATVTAVRGAQGRGARGNCSGHIGLISQTCSASIST